MSNEPVKGTVLFGIDDRQVQVSQEAYSIFMAREQDMRQQLADVSNERDGLRAERDAYRAVLDAAGYPNLEKLPHNDLGCCRQVGSMVATLTIALQQKADALQIQLKAIEARNAEAVRLLSKVMPLGGYSRQLIGDVEAFIAQSAPATGEQVNSVTSTIDKWVSK